MQSKRLGTIGKQFGSPLYVYDAEKYNLNTTDYQSFFGKTVASIMQ
jgi:diaminopimelate decarboxylase